MNSSPAHRYVNVLRQATTRTTMQYDMAKANLDRHPAHAIAAYLAGVSTG